MDGETNGVIRMKVLELLSIIVRLSYIYMVMISENGESSYRVVKGFVNVIGDISVAVVLPYSVIILQLVFRIDAEIKINDVNTIEL